jgi:hypothetical protein
MVLLNFKTAELAMFTAFGALLLLGGILLALLPVEIEKLYPILVFETPKTPYWLTTTIDYVAWSPSFAWSNFFEPLFQNFICTNFFILVEVIPPMLLIAIEHSIRNNTRLSLFERCFAMFCATSCVAFICYLTCLKNSNAFLMGATGVTGILYNRVVARPIMKGPVLVLGCAILLLCAEGNIATKAKNVFRMFWSTALSAGCMGALFNIMFASVFCLYALPRCVICQYHKLISLKRGMVLLFYSLMMVSIGLCLGALYHEKVEHVGVKIEDGLLAIANAEEQLHYFLKKLMVDGYNYTHSSLVEFGRLALALLQNPAHKSPRSVSLLATAICMLVSWKYTQK